jgi:tetratricopeptide (TPR) repeat protein
LNLIIDNYPDEKDAFFTLGTHNYLRGEYEKALDNYREVLALDPSNKMAYNQMAYVYDQMGNFEKSIWAINQYIELVPDEPNPYDTRADLYAYNGDIDNAITSYQKAIEIKPDFYRSIEKAGNMYLYKGDYENAEAMYQQLAASDQPSVRSNARTYSAVIALYQGRLQEALAVVDAAIAADMREGQYDESFMDKGRPKQAKEVARQGFGVFKMMFPRYSYMADLFLARVYAETDNYQLADSLLAPFESALDTLGDYARERYHFSKGLLALNREQPDTAASHLEMAVDLNPDNFTLRYLLAESCLRSGRVDDAIESLERLLMRFDETRLNQPTLAVRGYYLLGTAYEKAGRNGPAVEQYETFLQIWKDADPELSEVPDAKKRLEALKKSS